MGGLIFILPILAFDIWLVVTTGRRQVGRWVAAKNFRSMAIAAVVGIVLAVWLAFYFHFGYGTELRRGFPVPVQFYVADEKRWSPTAVPAVVLCVGYMTNLLTGLVAPFIPYKVGEFLKQVKAELK